MLSRSLCAGWWAYGSALALLMGTAAGLSGSSGALHTSWVGSLMVVHWRAYVCTREKVLPASLLDRESAKKFALRAQIGPNSAFLRLLGEIFRGNVTGGLVLGELFRANLPCAGLVGDAAHY